VSETTAESGWGGDAPGTDVDVWAPAGELEAEVVDAELIDDDGQPVDEAPELVANAEVVPWAVTDDPAAHGWGSHGRAPEQRQGDNDGARPGGGSGGGGGGAFTGRMSRKERKQRQKAAGGGGGDFVLFKYERRVNRTMNASLIDGRGAGSNNRAGIGDLGRSQRGNGGRSSRGSAGGSGGFGPKGKTIASKRGNR
jgi:hypothetical protein